MLNAPNRFLPTLLAIASLLCLPAIVSAQVEPPNRKYPFDEDANAYKRAVKKSVGGILKTDKVTDQDLGIDAPDVQYDKENGTANAKGGVVVSRSGIQAQSDEAKVNLQTKDSDLKGRVVVTSAQGTINAKQGKFNLESETGNFESATVDLEDGDYTASADKLTKLSEFDYNLFRSRMSTCHCTDGTIPWQIKGREANITQEGYAHVYGATMEFYGVPIAYSPYMLLPAKFERQSGLLRPSYNYSNRNGFEYAQPLFLVLDDSTDTTLTPFVQTQSRLGSDIDFRKVFSENNKAEGRFVFSNESARSNSLRGTNIQNPNNPSQEIADPTIDTNRTGGYYYQYWSTKPEDPNQMSLLADIHLVSDNLFPREMEENEIAKRDARYTNSQISARSNVGQYITAQVTGDYNQDLINPQKEVLQRLPEFTVNGLKSFHPFGYNPYGIKLVSGVTVDATDFNRQNFYDGWREDLAPTVTVPFHVANYVNGSAGLIYHNTNYQLNNNEVKGSTTPLESSNSRSIYSFTGNLSTALERVFEVDPSSWLTTLTGLGAFNQDNQLRRLKNTVSPFVKYYYTPKLDQADLPQFDSLDRIKPKSLVGYGLTSSLFGRFVPVRQSGDKIQELTPKVESLPIFDLNRPLADIGSSDEWAGVANFNVPQGDIRDLANLTLFQTYDLRSVHSGNTRIDSLSDVEADLGLNPTNSFGFKFASSYNLEAQEFKAWGIGNHIHDDRGDILRTQYSFIKDGQSQLEGSAEVVLTGRTKAAYYARYDNATQTIIESAALLRLASTCNCWHFDIGFNDKTNPDKKQFTLTLTFNGLGDLHQGFSQTQNNNS